MASAVVPALAHAQGTPAAGRRAIVELRADLLAAREATIHGGAGVLWPVGRSVSVGVQAGAGVSGNDAPGADDQVASGRAELVARFDLDPWAERRWGLYGSAGGGVLVQRGRSGRPVVFATVGVARRTSGLVAPAFELGLGGGVRVGVVLRRGR